MLTDDKEGQEEAGVKAIARRVEEAWDVGGRQHWRRDGHIGPRQGPTHLEQPGGQDDGDPVHHDAVDHFMRAGVGLEHADDASPDRSACDAGHYGQRQVDEPG